MYGKLNHYVIIYMYYIINYLLYFEQSEAGAEEVVDMRGRGGGGAGLTQTYGNEVPHCLWFGKVRPKKKKRVTTI